METWLYAAIFVFLISAAIVVSYLVIPKPAATMNITTKQDILTGFVSSSLKSDYVQPLDVKSAGPSLAVANWKVGDSEFTAFVITNSINGSVRKIETVIKVPVTSTALNLSLVNKYLKTSILDWACRYTAINQPQICESYFIVNKGKVGEVVVMSSGSTTIVRCELPVGSEIYSFNSCFA